MNIDKKRKSGNPIKAHIKLHKPSELTIINKTGLNPSLCRLILRSLQLGWNVTIKDRTQDDSN